jgi:hypothetical protein
MKLANNIPVADLRDFALLRALKSSSREQTVISIISFLRKVNANEQLCWHLMKLNSEKLHDICLTFSPDDLELFPFQFPYRPISAYKSLYIELLLFLHRKNGRLHWNNEPECLICTIEFGSSSRIMLIPCRHALCHFCVKKISPAICPICQHEFRLILPAI